MEYKISDLIKNQLMPIPGRSKGALTIVRRDTEWRRMGHVSNGDAIRVLYRPVAGIDADTNKLLVMRP